MKSCPYCKQTDVQDDAKKCPHCGEWLTRRPVRMLRVVVEGIGWLFISIFIIGLAGCGAMGVFG
jgi:hypothetical protein